MKTTLRYFVAVVLLGAMTCVSVNAQQVNTLYFLDNAPMRHYLNPAYQPYSNVYISLPIIGYTSLWAGNNSISLKDVIYKDAAGQTITFLHPNGDKAAFLDRIKNPMSVNTDIQLNLLSFGWRWKKAYWHVTLTEKMEGTVALPRDLFRFGLYGMDLSDMSKNTFDLTKLNMDASVYTELGLGYSRLINDQWTVGGKLKFLYGSANMSAKFDDLSVLTTDELWRLQGTGALRIAAPVTIPNDVLNDEFSITPSSNVLDWVKPAGLGGAIDLGATYKPIDMLTLSLSVTDLGFIRWRQNVSTVNGEIDYTYTGVGEYSYDEVTAQNFMDTVTNFIVNGLKSASTVGETSHDAYTLMTTAKLNFGAEVNFWDNRVGVGVHSRTSFARKKVYEEVTLGANFRPYEWVNLAASYSFVNGRFNSIGAALGLRGGPLQLTLMADYIPFTYAAVSQNASPTIPYNIKGVNLGVGISLVFGHDKDRDGVVNRKDLCPETPRGVIVDEVGCPVDTDKDGVPDYLDECPDTPAEAYGMVDEKGCPIDTDGDGVPDYMDRCPDTPEAAYGLVDEFGCPLDTDEDGVPDYLDECPDTPREAYGMVDEKGCPLDTDGDGVPDYMDRCPDTPAEAYGQVDEFGCPKDDDNDGVPNYLDKCPDTKPEAVRFVDDCGCDLDTDGDGVPDYMDECPKTPGTVENHGCPEVKKEVRTLFTKALQGIQFETGKAVIKRSSYMILRQIAKVLIENPTYLVEIQGHTDNVGNDDLNMSLSEKRANAVRDFLIKEGVDANRMTAKGYGETMPVADNKTAAGRAKNRRVEFIVSFEAVTYE